MEKEKKFSAVKDYLQDEGFEIDQFDMQRPWGGFFVIKESNAQKFIKHFFSDLPGNEVSIVSKVSPKILLVEPGKKLSWQYHHRRSEIWKLIEGTAAVIRSETDEERQPENLKIGDTVKLYQGERHRLLGLEDWGVIAEIWIHSDANNLSDENDIVRLQDDFGR